MTKIGGQRTTVDGDPLLIHWRHTFIVFGLVGIVWDVACSGGSATCARWMGEAAELRIIGLIRRCAAPRVPWGAMLRARPAGALSCTGSRSTAVLHITGCRPISCPERLSGRSAGAALPLLSIAASAAGRWVGGVLARHWGPAVTRRTPGIVACWPRSRRRCHFTPVPTTAALLLAAAVDGAAVRPAWAVCLDRGLMPA